MTEACRNNLFKKGNGNMEENVNLEVSAQPDTENENLPSAEATIPQADTTDSAFLEVKFNKETKKLSLDEAATLAQKGMKFDMIEGQFDRLKALSKKEGLSVGEYLTGLEKTLREEKISALAEKCSGDRELAEKLYSLEEAQGGENEELFAVFPELESEQDIPEEVKTAAQIKGTGLLFEYLLYDRRLRVAAAEEEKARRLAQEASLGGLSSSSKDVSDAEFLKGVWG